MKFILNKDRVCIEEYLNANVSGTVNYYEIPIEYDETWNDLTIKAIIIKKDEDTGEEISVIGNKFYIDKEKSGTYRVGFVGYTIENDEKVYQISTNLISFIIDKGAGEIEGVESHDIPTPSEWEIYIAQIQEMIDDIGSETDYNNLQNKPQINNVELTGNKSLHDLGIQPEGNYYTKPNNGIPNTDMTEEVQTSLQKADTALQEHQSLTDYVKNTDYATDSKGGVLKTNGSAFAIGINASGELYAGERTYAQYQAHANNAFIGKGTLENVIAGKGLVSDTDYATDQKAGVVKTNWGSGTYMSNGALVCRVADYNVYQQLGASAFVSKGTLENVLTEKIGNIETILTTLDVGGGLSE